MSDQELPPASFVFDVAGDVSHGSYGVSRTVTATGVRYIIGGPLAQAIKAMLDAHWIAGRDAAADVAESVEHNWAGEQSDKFFTTDPNYVYEPAPSDAIRALTPPKNNPVVIVDEDATTWKNLANYYSNKIFKLEDELKNLRRSLVSKTLPKR